jgi:release factor glutamine methyltransferase
MEILDSVYAPREDSFLLEKELIKYIKKYKPKRILDMGTGSGIQAIAAKKLGVEKVVAVDINLEAIKCAKINASRLDIAFIESNLFSNISEKFDLIAFNTPYLPPEPPLDPQWSGGNKFIEEFLNQSKLHLTFNGKIIFIHSSKSPIYMKHTILSQKKMSDGEMIYVSLR